MSQVDDLVERIRSDSDSFPGFAEFCAGFSTLSDFWSACPRSDWMLLAIRYCGLLTPEVARPFVYQCLLQISHMVSVAGCSRVLEALRLSEENKDEPLAMESITRELCLRHHAMDVLRSVLENFTDPLGCARSTSLQSCLHSASCAESHLGRSPDQVLADKRQAFRRARSEHGKLLSRLFGRGLPNDLPSDAPGEPDDVAALFCAIGETQLSDDVRLLDFSLALARELLPPAVQNELSDVFAVSSDHAHGIAEPLAFDATRQYVGAISETCSAALAACESNDWLAALHSSRHVASAMQLERFRRSSHEDAQTTVPSAGNVDLLETQEPWMIQADMLRQLAKDPPFEALPDDQTRLVYDTERMDDLSRARVIADLNEQLGPSPEKMVLDFGRYTPFAGNPAPISCDYARELLRPVPRNRYGAGRFRDAADHVQSCDQCLDWARAGRPFTFDLSIGSHRALFHSVLQAALQRRYDWPKSFAAAESHAEHCETCAMWLHYTTAVQSCSGVRDLLAQSTDHTRPDYAPDGPERLIHEHMAGCIDCQTWCFDTIGCASVREVVETVARHNEHEYKRFETVGPIVEYHLRHCQDCNSWARKSIKDTIVLEVCGDDNGFNELHRNYGRIIDHLDRLKLRFSTYGALQRAVDLFMEAGYVPLGSTEPLDEAETWYGFLKYCSSSKDHAELLDLVMLQHESGLINDAVALCVAMATESRNAVGRVLDAGLNVEATFEERPVLSIAAEQGTQGIVAEILARGANANATDAEANTALHHAAAEARTRMAEALLAYGASVNSQNHAGVQPLHRAAESGSTDMVELLLVCGADINARAATGTPLICAVSAKQTMVVEYLRARGAEPAWVCCVNDWLNGAVAEFPSVIRSIDLKSLDIPIRIAKAAERRGIVTLGELIDTRCEGLGVNASGTRRFMAALADSMRPLVCKLAIDGVG